MIKQIPSPHFTKGRINPIKIIIIHISTGSLTSLTNTFTNPASKVSSHYGVGFKGEKIQYVQDVNTAWHSGNPNKPTYPFKPGETPNSISIGIECEGTDLSKAPVAQINALSELVKSLCGKYNIPCDRAHIIGHSEVNSITRKNCPSPDLSILDKIVKLSQVTEEMVSVQIPKSKVEMVMKFMLQL